MCGIFGVYSESGISRIEAIQYIQKSWSLNQHRGPDGRGALIKSINGEQKLFHNYLTDVQENINLVLTHNRLAIIDLSNDGLQPMQDISKRFSISFNGEIYNYIEIRNELKSCGVSFIGDTDTEVILQSWKKWGPNSIAKFVGMFAFVLHDSRDNSLYLVRDRVGIKPLYYSHINDGSIGFSSEQTTLIEAGFLDFVPNWSGVISGMMFQGALRPETVYEKIHAVPPGHYLKFKDCKLFLEEYWDLEEKSCNLSYSEVVDRANYLLSEAIKSTLVSDVPVASLLSGGLDSTLMVNELCKYISNSSAFTLAWSSNDGADSEFVAAKSFAQRNKINHTKCLIRPDDILSDFDEMLNTFQEPIGVLEPHMPISQKLNQNNVKVVLAGLGPDEMLGGYGHYKYIKIWEKFRYFPKCIPEFDGRFGKLIRFLSAKNPADAYITLFNGYLWNKPDDIFTPDVIPSGWNPLQIAKRSFPKAWDNISDPIKIFNYLDLKIYIGTHHNLTSDQFLMRKGIEGRFPYLDHRWMEFLFNLPTAYKIDNSNQKVLMKILAKDLMSDSQINSKKIGFGIPEDGFVNNAKFKNRLNDMCSHVMDTGIVKKEVVLNLVQKSTLDRKESRKLIYLASLSRWLR